MQSLSGKRNIFARECNVLLGNAMFLGRMQYFCEQTSNVLLENADFLRRTQYSVLQDNANVLRDNAKFL